MTSRFPGPLTNETAPEPPVTVKPKSPAPPLLRIESAGGVIVTTQGAGVGVGVGCGVGVGSGERVGDGIGVGLG